MRCRLPLTAAHCFIYFNPPPSKSDKLQQQETLIRGLCGRQKQPAVASPIRDVTRQLPLRLFRRFKQLFSILTPYGESHVISGARFLWQNFPISLYTVTSRYKICILHRFAHDRDGPAGLLIGRGEQFERFLARLASAYTTNEPKRDPRRNFPFLSRPAPQVPLESLTCTARP